MFAELSAALAETAQAQASATPQQGWVGIAAVAAGVVLGAVAVLRRTRQVSLARRRRVGPTHGLAGPGAGTPRNLANGPLR